MNYDSLKKENILFYHLNNQTLLPINVNLQWMKINNLNHRMKPDQSEDIEKLSRILKIHNEEERYISFQNDSDDD